MDNNMNSNTDNKSVPSSGQGEESQYQTLATSMLEQLESSAKSQAVGVPILDTAKLQEQVSQYSSQELAAEVQVLHAQYKGFLRKLGYARATEKTLRATLASLEEAERQKEAKLLKLGLGKACLLLLEASGSGIAQQFFPLDSTENLFSPPEPSVDIKLDTMQALDDAEALVDSIEALEDIVLE